MRNTTPGHMASSHPVRGLLPKLGYLVLKVPDHVICHGSQASPLSQDHRQSDRNITSRSLDQHIVRSMCWQMFPCDSAGLAATMVVCSAPAGMQQIERGLAAAPHQSTALHLSCGCCGTARTAANRAAGRQGTAQDAHVPVSHADVALTAHIDAECTRTAGRSAYHAESTACLVVRSVAWG